MLGNLAMVPYWRSRSSSMDPIMLLWIAYVQHPVDWLSCNISMGT